MLVRYDGEVYASIYLLMDAAWECGLPFFNDFNGNSSAQELCLGG
jgi:hypothetical protein